MSNIFNFYGHDTQQFIELLKTIRPTLEDDVIIFYSDEFDENNYKENPSYIKFINNLGDYNIIFIMKYNDNKWENKWVPYINDFNNIQYSFKYPTSYNEVIIDIDLINVPKRINSKYYLNRKGKGSLENDYKIFATHIEKSIVPRRKI